MVTSKKYLAMFSAASKQLWEDLRLLKNQSAPKCQTKKAILEIISEVRLI